MATTRYAYLASSAIAVATLAVIGGELPAQAAPLPYGSDTVVFEVTGSGTVYSIDTDPAGARVAEDTPLPWQRSITVGPDVQLLQVVAVGKTASPGCRILLDGKVVAEQPVGGNAHCIFDRA